MADVTHLLNAIHAGDPQAAADLLPLVYDELRQLAAAKMQHEKPGHTLNATALVHEAYLRLVANSASESASPGRESGVSFHNRAHFFAAAAEAMRRILVDRARARNALKRGGIRHRVELKIDQIVPSEERDELLAIDEVLDRLVTVDPTTAELVKLRYFVGLSMEETAAVLGISLRKAERLWTFGRAWLRQAIQEMENR